MAKILNVSFKTISHWENGYSEPNINQIIANLKNAGFTHCGFNQYFESVKPRWEAELDLRKDTNTLFKDLSKQTRNKLRKATKYGLSVYKDNKYDFNQIYHLIKDKYSLNKNNHINKLTYNNFTNSIVFFYR